MKPMIRAILSVCAIASTGSAFAQSWPAPQSPAIPAGRGYRPIPNVAEPIDPTRTYKALFDSVRGPAKPTDRLPVLERVSLVLNGAALGGVARDKTDIAIIFHGPAVDALLKNEIYRQKHGVDNPNLELISQLQGAGVRFLVCGQYLASTDTPVANLLDGVRPAEGATLVMIKLANAGYAVIPD
jgi:intracellular sulfur oxidation DsrE/DsrF family protein